MSPHDADFGNRPAWVALLTLPPVLFALTMVRGMYWVRMGELPMGFTALAAQPDPLYAELFGLAAAGLVAVVFGPHLTLLLSLAGLFCAWGAASYLEPYEVAHHTLTVFESASFVSLLGAIGVSTGGGAPGLRYAAAFAAWAAWVIAPSLSSSIAGLGLVPVSWLAMGLIALSGLVALVSSGSWWFEKRHPRPAAVDSTFRVAGAVGVGIALVVAVYAVDSLRTRGLFALPPRLPILGTWAHAAHIGAAFLTASGMALLGVVLQVIRSPSRVGSLVGLGCMLVSLAGVWAWTSQGEWLIPIGLLSGAGQALVLPWAWARSTSDTHWRIATLFAAMILFAPHIVDTMTPLWPIACMMSLALAAIPVGALGWFADDWVFGDVPGSSADPRSRR